MTRYKQYMKKHYNIQFDEDWEYLPYPVDDNGVVLEGRDAFVTRYGILVVSFYNVDISRVLYLPNGTVMDVHDGTIECGSYLFK